mgnify:FL=1|tara:strand:+ start:499 stop:1035 length:537 start_codon:yes stop_codon:yes gene_type:complete
MKLHIGCGNIIIPGWVNLDIQSTPGVDIIDDARSLHSIKDNSCDIIYACCVLEHFSRNNIINILKVWNTKLKENGILRIAVPDFLPLAMWYTKNRDLTKLLGLLIGGHKDPFDKHGMIFDEKILTDLLTQAGFSEIHSWDWRQVDHGHIDDYSQSYLPHMDKENGILMSLNLEARKTI